MNKSNKLVVSLLMILVVALVAGGTYVWLVITASTTNGVYNLSSTCFVVDYVDNTDQITGTMFPSADHTKGLTGGLSMKINNSCNVEGKGALYLHVNSASTKLLTTAAAHCENPTTLTTMKEYKTSASCTSAGGSWTTTGKVLKYAIYDNPEGTGTPVKVGYYSGSNGDNQLLHSDFNITKTQLNYYVYFWLDGYITDNTYTNLTFSGYIYTTATQSESILLPVEYQRVEYLQSSGTQYILTNVVPTNTTGAYAKIVSKNTSSDLLYFGSKGSGNSRFWIGNTSNGLYFGWNTALTPRPTVSTTTTSIIQMNYLNNRLNIHNNSTIHTNIATLASNSYPIAIFAGNNAGTIGNKSSIQLYELKISEGNGVIRDFIPCYRKSDNVGGVYDTVTGTFYTNAGSGTFTYGANIN